MEINEADEIESQDSRTKPINLGEHAIKLEENDEYDEEIV